MYTAQVANYYGLGEKRSKFEDGSNALDTIECDIDGECVKIIQNAYGIGTAKTDLSFVPTTRIEINSNIPYENFKSIVNDVCLLLKLVSLSHVVASHYFENSEFIEREDVRGVSIKSRPVLETCDGAIVRKFIESTWINFRKYKDSRKLNVAIDLLTIAEESWQVQEVKLAIMFMLLENLKSTYAHSKGILFYKNYFRIISASCPVKPGKTPPKYDFIELLTEMLGVIGMGYDLTKIIDLRNDIFHSAISERPFEEQREIYEDCQDLVREYLLRLLGYHGGFFTYKSRCTEVKYI